jgi:hypothetical protein
MPDGDAIVVEADEEFAPMQPTSIAFAVAVVSPGTVADVAAGPDARVAATSRPVAPE